MNRITFFIIALIASANIPVTAGYFPNGVQYTTQGMPYGVQLPQVMPYGMQVPQGMPYGMQMPQGMPYGQVPQGMIPPNAVGYMPPVPAMPYPNMPPIPAAPPLPQYSGVPSFVPSPLAPYANEAGQGLYNAVIPEYGTVTGEAENEANSRFAEEEQAVSSKVESTKSSVSNEAKNRVTAGEKAISDKVAATKNAVSSEVSNRLAGGKQAVSDKAKNSFESTMSGFKGIMGNF